MCFRENVYYKTNQYDGYLLSIKSRLEFICTKKNVINIEYAYSPRVTIKQKSESKTILTQASGVETIPNISLSTLASL